MKSLLFTSPANINRWMFFNNVPEGPSSGPDIVTKSPENDEKTKKTLTPIEQINIAGSKILYETEQSSPKEVIEDAFASIDSIRETAKKGYLLVGKQKISLSPQAQTYILSVDFAKSVMETVSKDNTEKSQEESDTIEIQKTIDNFVEEFRQSNQSVATFEIIVKNTINQMSTNKNLSDIAKEYMYSFDFKTRMLDTLVAEGLMEPPDKQDLDKISNMAADNEMPKEGIKDAVRTETEKSKDIPGIKKYEPSLNYEKTISEGIDLTRYTMNLSHNSLEYLRVTLATKKNVFQSVQHGKTEDLYYVNGTQCHWKKDGENIVFDMPESSTSGKVSIPLKALKLPLHPIKED